MRNLFVSKKDRARRPRNVINGHDSTRHRDERKLKRGFHDKLRIQSKQIGVLQGRHCPFRGKMWVETRHIKHRHPVAGAM